MATIKDWKELCRIMMGESWLEVIDYELFNSIRYTMNILYTVQYSNVSSEGFNHNVKGDAIYPMAIDVFNSFKDINLDDITTILLLPKPELFNSGRFLYYYENCKSTVSDKRINYLIDIITDEYNRLNRTNTYDFPIEDIVMDGLLVMNVSMTTDVNAINNYYSNHYSLWYKITLKLLDNIMKYSIKNGNKVTIITVGNNVMNDISKFCEFVNDVNDTTYDIKLIPNYTDLYNNPSLLIDYLKNLFVLE